MDAKDFLNAARDLCLSIDKCEDCKLYVVGHGCILYNEPADYNVDMIMGTFDVATKNHDKPVVKIKLFPGGKMPVKKTAGAAAWDCYARIDVPEAPKDEMWIPKGHRGAKVPLGFAMEIPEGYHAEIFLRSSTGAKTPFRVSNSAGIIDSDYRGEVCALIDNINWCMPEVVRDGDRIVQMLIVKDPDVELVEADELSKTDRGASSFGSTGKR